MYRTKRKLILKNYLLVKNIEINMTEIF